MKRILMIFVITFVLFINSNVYADGICDPSNINRMKEIAKNIEVSYEHNVYGSIEDETFGSVYHITIYGLTDEIYILDSDGNTYYYEMMKDGVLTIITSSGERKLYIYSKECLGKLLHTINLNLPIFNFNSLNKECQKDEFKDLDVCREFLEKDEEIISSDVFDKEIEEENKKNQSIVHKIKDFAIENIIYIVIGSAFLFVIIVLLLLRHRKRSVLE